MIDYRHQQITMRYVSSHQFALNRESLQPTSHNPG